jgi:hypothetical protein
MRFPFLRSASDPLSGRHPHTAGTITLISLEMALMNAPA